ncbi:DUF3006 domain-containing protein [Paenisporosarcina quisquiliarum]|uniref:DUF3006 domain-containing protein n=1 Tax=Paenisporosarcina quisquiliarum TaxID=365346 RepID=UPI003736BC59
MSPSILYTLDRFEEGLAILLQYPCASNVLVVPIEDLNNEMHLGTLLSVEIEIEGFVVKKVTKHKLEKTMQEMNLVSKSKINDYKIDFKKGCLIYTVAS